MDYINDQFCAQLTQKLTETYSGWNSGLIKLDEVIFVLESIIGAIREFFPDQESFQSIADYAQSGVEILLAEDAIRIARGRGRPAITVDMSVVEQLLSMRFSATSIAKMFGLSIYTLRRKMSEYGLKVRDTYTQLTDDKLGELMEEILLEFPNTGYKRMRGYLLAKGEKVAEMRVRHMMREVDPDGVFQRARRNRAIVRRVYYVPHSNDLWHIDTNLKLRRWRMVMKAGIDGKSRLCTYITMGADNTSRSHFDAFREGVKRYGVPSRCRSDKGGENVDIARFMLEKRGTGRGSHICARSVHNQRIERYWRDASEGCMDAYRCLFLTMERLGKLNPENEVDMRVLHYVMLPRINRSLQRFAQGWNFHPLSTESNASPIQLFISNLPTADHDLEITNIAEPTDVPVDYEGDLLGFRAHTDLTLPEPVPKLSMLEEMILWSYQPLRDCDDLGYAVYEEAKNAILSYRRLCGLPV